MTDDRRFLTALGEILRRDGVDDHRKYQLALLEALRAVDRLCREHDIVYWLDGGTLLGAVRHDGFIPWDDDVDIVMPRADYRRFRALAEQALPAGLVLETPTRHLGHYHAWTRVLHLGGFAWEIPDYPGESIGLYLDVFPVDTAGEDRHLALPGRLNRWSNRFRRGLTANPLDRLRNALSVLIGRLLRGYCQWHSARGRATHLYYGAETPFFRRGPGVPLESVYPLREIGFEGVSLPAPADTDRYLRALYGGDYLQLPPPEQRLAHCVNLRLIEREHGLSA